MRYTVKNGLRIKPDLLEKTITDYEGNSDALRLISLLFESDNTIFLTGKAGAGKTTLVKRITEIVPNTLVVAPTGIAASNAGGTTIHKAFLLPFGILDRWREYRLHGSNAAVLAKADLIVIDEVSMLRADVLLAIDTCMRQNLLVNKPFGGKRVLLVGDLFQLPPVLKNEDSEEYHQIYKSVFFFDCGISEIKLSVVELNKVYRQKSGVFIDILNRIRKGNHTQECIDVLNEKVDTFFEQTIDTPHINLVSTNQLADGVNARMFTLCQGPTYTYESIIVGEFDLTKVNAEITLKLKVGLRIIFIINDKGGRFFNGSQGTIVALDDDCVTVNINGKVFGLSRYEWKNIEYKAKGSDITENVKGTFSQFPIRLGYAITIHKSQGCTFNHAIIDLGFGAFAHGQLYVALSRLTDIEGLILRRKIKEQDIIVSDTILEFMNR